MKTLLVMRHAKSSWEDATLSDHDRPLNNRGKEDAPKMGAHLKEKGLAPELIISSTAKRAKATAELVGQGCNYSGEIIYNRDFFHAGVDEYLDGIMSVPKDEDVILIVGHNPGMEELLDYLTDAPESMSTANIAVVQLDIDEWQDLDLDTEAKLETVLRPKEV